MSPTTIIMVMTIGRHDHHHHADDAADDDDHDDEQDHNHQESRRKMPIPRVSLYSAICTYPSVYPLATLLDMMKDAGLRIRIDRNLRDTFLKVCRAQDKPAAQVIREFMREYIASHGTNRQNRSKPVEERQK